LDQEEWEKSITPRTRIVSIAHMSNVLGTINPVKEIAVYAHKQGALFIVDAAQSAPHLALDVRQIDCDFLAFSGHKMLGPTGIGILFGKEALLEKLDPFLYGGDMIREVRFEGSTWNELPWKFEAGTPNIVGGIGLGTAVDYLKGVGMPLIRQHEEELTAYALERLQGLDGLEIYGPKDAKKKGGVVAFNLKGVHAHDVAFLLDERSIAVRGGHHCAMPLASILGINSSARASFYLYNTQEDIDALCEGLKDVKRIFK
ncbi:MAG: aminotransferase class V-fold PLP-dependent enzyme, partial [Candidatus Tectomicrobia bacterium]|nr:aminotransferase class V-fold PLP-dependent enzyme [Candidatus Tectomicrobia bacterium]